MKIVTEVRSSRYFVIGGLTGDETECEIKCFEAACKSIGEALRDLDHSLIICSPSPDNKITGYLADLPKAVQKTIVQLRYILLII